MKIKKIIEKYSSTPVIGVDIGDGAIRAAEFACGDSVFQLGHWSMNSCHQNNASRVLGQMICQNGFKNSEIAVAVSSPELIVRSLQFPKMPPKELAAAIRLEAEQCILNGHKLSDMAVDWHRLTASNDKIRGVLAVVPKEVIAGQIETAKAAGLTPRVVDVACLAVWNAYWSLRGCQENHDGPVLLLNLGDRTTNLVIARGPDEILLARDLTLGWDDISNGSQEDWILEIHDSMVYARSNYKLRHLNECVVTGRSADPDILLSLNSLTGCQASLWNPLESIPRGIQEIPDNDTAVQFSLPLGLALRRGA